MNADPASLLERARPRLFGLAYRMLGTRSDADDVVQDVFARWLAHDRTDVENPDGWLTTVCARRAIDRLRAVRRQRTHYVGAWLPEPLHGHLAAGDEALASSTETALLIALERLSPRERAAFLLTEVFGRPHRQVAEMLRTSEAACRKLASRARAKLRGIDRDAAPTAVPDRAILQAFEQALADGDATILSSLLTEDARLTADGGGRAAAAPSPLLGRAAILGFAAQARIWWRDYEVSIEWLTHGEALVVRDGPEAVAVLWSGPLKGGGTSALYVMRNPEKLGGFHADSR